jgi:NitT/TauT family transport system substrate-binding protein
MEVRQMKKTMIALAASLGLATAAAAQDDVRLQLKWVTQAQFAGYYVAQAEGFYKDENLNVTILPGGPDIAPEQVIAAGGADVITTWMPAALAARERGLNLVNIALPFKHGGLKQAFNVDALLQKQADCISVMTYNEYGQVLDAGITPDQLVTFNYLNEGVGVLEDGLYATEEQLADPAFADKMVRFVRASMKGWKWAEQNPEAAAQIVIDNDQTGAQTLAHQVYMMGEVAKLTAGSNGALDPADYDQTVATLLSGVSPDNPAITKAPEGMAWTHEITDKALN